MSDGREEDIKPSSSVKLPSTDESQNRIGEQILKSKAEMEKIKEGIDELRKEMNELKKDKTPYGVIMKSPVIFVCGLFIGVLVMGCYTWHEIEERKELRKELIEYVDKMVTRIEANK